MQVFLIFSVSFTLKHAAYPPPHVPSTAPVVHCASSLFQLADENIVAERYGLDIDVDAPIDVSFLRRHASDILVCI